MSAGADMDVPSSVGRGFNMRWTTTTFVSAEVCVATAPSSTSGSDWGGGWCGGEHGVLLRRFRRGGCGDVASTSAVAAVVAPRADTAAAVPDGAKGKACCSTMFTTIESSHQIQYRCLVRTISSLSNVVTSANFSATNFLRFHVFSILCKSGFVTLCW